MSSGLTEHQVLAIDIAERVTSVLSILGLTFIISTFLLTRRFRRPINRLIFYASFGNLLSNIATLIARKAINELKGRKYSTFCSFQGFLLQVFMPADALFALCMAINVYLNVKHKFEALSLRKLELYYVSFSYLCPFVVGFVLLFIYDESRGHVYGDAIIWCWIARDWDFLRIAVFYGPVWVSILSTFFLYAFTFRIILRLRRSLRQFQHQEKQRKSELSAQQILVHSGQPMPSSAALPEAGSRLGTENSIISQSQKAHLSFIGRIRESVIDSAYNLSTSTSGVHKDIEEEICAAPPVDIEKFPFDPTHGTLDKAKSAMKANKAAFAYARCAMLFFIGLLITWLPSSMNRVYSYVHKDTNFPLSFLSALVLPAQGFWNFTVYTGTSWKSCVSLWEDVRSRGRRDSDSKS